MTEPQQPTRNLDVVTGEETVVQSTAYFLRCGGCTSRIKAAPANDEQPTDDGMRSGLVALGWFILPELHLPLCPDCALHVPEARPAEPTGEIRYACGGSRATRVKWGPFHRTIPTCCRATVLGDVLRLPPMQRGGWALVGATAAGKVPDPNNLMLDALCPEHALDVLNRTLDGALPGEGRDLLLQLRAHARAARPGVEVPEAIWRRGFKGAPAPKMHRV